MEETNTHLHKEGVKTENAIILREHVKKIAFLADASAKALKQEKPEIDDFERKKKKLVLKENFIFFNKYPCENVSKYLCIFFCFILRFFILRKKIVFFTCSLAYKYSIQVSNISYFIGVSPS